MPVAPQDRLYTAFPKEGWVASLEVTNAVLAEIQEMSRGSTERQANAIYIRPKSARGLLWHLPGGVVINFLLNIEKDHRGTMSWLATGKSEPEDFEDAADVPGGDLDAWRRYIERVRFSAAVLAKSILFDEETLKRLAEILRKTKNLQALQSSAVGTDSE